MITPFRLHAALLTPLSNERMAWHPHGALVVDERGSIAWRGDEAALPETFLPLPAMRSPHVLLPGLIDVHVHLPQLDCRGKFGASLLEWLDRFIYPEEMRFADEAVARDVARRFHAALIAAGTTTAMVYGTVHERATDIAFEEAERAGLRIILGKVLMDREAPEELLESAIDGLSATERLIERWHRKTPRLWYAVTPRFALSCTTQMLTGAAVLAKRHDTYVQTHCNESGGEIARVAELFPEAAHYTGVYEAAGLLTPRTVLGHNIHTDDEQLAMLRAHGCAVAHCPDSNLFLGSGRFPIEMHEHHGVHFALGSDVGAGTTLSMFHIMHAMSHVQARSLHPFEPLYRATLGGAAALGLEDSIGSLDAGKEADMIEVEIEQSFCRGKRLQDLSAQEIASVLVYRSANQRVGRVWVGGEKISERGGTEDVPTPSV
ncbi:MAG: guanine deaminase [Bacteroidetes bacterium]|nr:guanine deaminase [Bacteroidota bacterium]